MRRAEPVATEDDVPAIIGGIFELGAKVDDVLGELVAIRRLLEGDGEEGTEEDPDG